MATNNFTKSNLKGFDIIYDSRWAQDYSEEDMERDEISFDDLQNDVDEDIKSCIDDINTLNSKTNYLELKVQEGYYESFNLSIKDCGERWDCPVTLDEDGNWTISVDIDYTLECYKKNWTNPVEEFLEDTKCNLVKHLEDLKLLHDYLVNAVTGKLDNCWLALVKLTPTGWGEIVFDYDKDERVKLLDNLFKDLETTCKNTYKSLIDDIK